jgi:hypothetical protein
VRRLKWLLLAVLGLWGVTAYPAWKYGGDQALLQCTVAMLLSLVPAAATMAFTIRAFRQPAAVDQQMLAVLGGCGVRLFVAIGAGWMLTTQVAELSGVGFWMWLGVYYLFALGVEVFLIVHAAGRS